MKPVVDFYGPHDQAFYSCLALNGYHGIARYLTDGPDPRAITAQEVAFAHNAGLEIHFFYEMRPTYVGYFTEKQGAADARAALTHLRALGAPNGTVVYFTVDAPPGTIPPFRLDPYFKAVEETLKAEGGGLIVPGIYGFEAHIVHARLNYPNVGKHLWQTYGNLTGPLDAWQHEQLNECGVDIDINDCYVTGWKKEIAMDSPVWLGQSADSIVLKVGEVSPLEGVWRYSSGLERTQVEKVIGRKPGRFVYIMYPKVDPDADETRDLGAQPSLFLVTVTDL